MSLGIFCFLIICIVGGIIFVIFKMLIPSLSIRPISIGALTIAISMILLLGLLGGVFFNQLNRKNPLVIQLYQKGVQFEGSKGLVPYKDIQISRGKMEGMTLVNGAATTFPLGEALIFKINHFDRYFNISLLKKFSDEYQDKDTYKVPIGEKGLTESQITEFLEFFNRLSTSEE